jgi:hypothetical protein
MFVVNDGGLQTTSRDWELFGWAASEVECERDHPRSLVQQLFQDVGIINFRPRQVLLQECFDESHVVDVTRFDDQILQYLRIGTDDVDTAYVKLLPFVHVDNK